jgi:uncharacterized cupin superfamily protein
MFEKVEQARLRRTDAGLTPEGDGWYVVNVAEAAGSASPTFGGRVSLAGFREEVSPSQELAVNIRLLQPGEPNAYYHREGVDEAFLVLQGECVAIVEDRELDLRKGDFLWAPAGTGHIFVGAGEQPCAILMMSRRIPDEDEVIEYPVSEAAARHGASVSQATDSVEEAYAGAGKRVPKALGELF